MDGKSFLNSFLATLAALVTIALLFKAMKMARKGRRGQNGNWGGRYQQQYMQQQPVQQVATNGQQPASFSPNNSIPQQNMPFTFANN